MEPAGPPKGATRIEAIADEAFALLGSGRQTTPFSARDGGLDLSDAYRVTDLVRTRRVAAGERVVGRKIGFTNRTIWAEYDVWAPIWGYVYDRTLRDLSPDAAFPLRGLAEPRIEPEIVFGIAAPLSPDMDERALLSSIAWVAHGFEIVQSLFPAWKFAASDCIAGFGLHGALHVGPRHAIDDVGGWLKRLGSFEIDLFRNGEPVDSGKAENVLGGPLSALRHLVALLADDPINPPLAAGEVVTTGTLTRAFPIAAGEGWSTRLRGIDLEGAAIRFT